MIQEADKPVVSNRAADLIAEARLVSAKYKEAS